MTTTAPGDDDDPPSSAYSPSIDPSTVTSTPNSSNGHMTTAATTSTIVSSNDDDIHTWLFWILSSYRWKLITLSHYHQLRLLQLFYVLYGLQCARASANCTTYLYWNQTVVMVVPLRSDNCMDQLNSFISILHLVCYISTYHHFYAAMQLSHSHHPRGCKIPCQECPSQSTLNYLSRQSKCHRCREPPASHWLHFDYKMPAGVQLWEQSNDQGSFECVGHKCARGEGQAQGE